MRTLFLVILLLSLSAFGATVQPPLRVVTIDVVPSPGSSTYGIQEALNQVPAGGPGWGTNVTGALIRLKAGDYYFTNAAYYSNTYPYNIHVQGAGILATRLIYAGLGTTTNMLTFAGGGNPNGGLNLPGNVEVDHLTLSSITNMQAAFLVITNSSYEYIHDVNVTGWEVTTNNLHGPSLSIDGPAPTQAPGNVGMIIGSPLDHATIAENVFCAGLACGIDVQGDHFYGSNLKSAYIGQYGAGPSDGTAWANTSPYSLGVFVLRHGGLSTDIKDIHCYQVNTAIAQDGASGNINLINVQFETVTHGICEFNAAGSTATWFVYNGGVLADDSGGPFTITHAPYALSTSTVVDVRYPTFTKMLSNTGLNGSGNIISNFANAQFGKVFITNGLFSSTNSAVASAAITFPNTTVNWTNSFGFNIALYIDNTGVTGTVTKKNNQQVYSALVGDVLLLLKPGDYFSETYSVGTPTARWEPQ